MIQVRGLSLYSARRIEEEGDAVPPLVKILANLLFFHLMSCSRMRPLFPSAVGRLKRINVNEKNTIILKKGREGKRRRSWQQLSFIFGDSGASYFYSDVKSVEKITFYLLCHSLVENVQHFNFGKSSIIIYILWMYSSMIFQQFLFLNRAICIFTMIYK